VDESASRGEVASQPDKALRAMKPLRGRIKALRAVKLLRNRIKIDEN
jgi:hypothetical protein